MPTATKKAAQAADSASADLAKEALSADLSELRKDFDALRSDIGALVKDAGHFASAKGQEGVKRGQALGDEVAKSAGDVRDQLEEKVRAQPVMALGLALGAGALVGLLARR